MLLRMKRTILCFLLLLSFAACHRFDGAKQSLLLIDSLSVSEPERALSLLDSMQAQSDSLPRRLRMKYHFLRVRAKDKAYQSLQSDTIMERVARYYRHHGTANEAMEATYLLGGVYRDRGESPRALDVYLSASEQADTTRPDCNYGILARIHGQMAELFEKQFLPENELEEIKKGQYYALKDKDTLMSLIFEQHRALSYIHLNQYDKAANISEKCFIQCQRLGANQQAVFFITPAIYGYLKKGKIDKAEHYIGLLSNNFTDESKVTPQQLGGYFYLKALLALNKEELDTAEKFFRKQIEVNPTLNAKVNTYAGLAKVFSLRRDIDSLTKYSLLSTACQDSLLMDMRSSKDIRSHALYEYNKSKLLIKSKTIKIQRLLIGILLLTLFLLLIVVFSTFVYRYYRAKMETAVHQANQNYLKLLEDYSSSLSQLDTIHAAQSEKDSLIKKLQNEIMSYEEKFKLIAPNENLCELLHNSLILELHRRASHRERITADEILKMKDIMMKLYPTFIEKLMHHDIHLKHNYIETCCLLKLGFLPAEVAELLCTSPQNISNIRSRIYQIITGKTGNSKDFNNLLKEIN